MTSHDPVPEPASGDHSCAPNDDLVPLRRSFPVPKRRRVTVSRRSARRIDWQGWGIRGLFAAAVVMAGFAMWIRLRPEGRHPAPALATTPVSVPAAAPLPEPVPEGPPDAAQDIYLTVTPSVPPPAVPAVPAPQPSPAVAVVETPVPAATPVPAPAPTTPPETADDSGFFEMLQTEPGNLQPAESGQPESGQPESAAAPAVALSDLDSRYLAALKRAAASAQGQAAVAWTAEIERVKSGSPLPAADDSQPAELQRLQSIYRRESEKQSAPVITPAAVPPDARRIELYFMADDAAVLLVNGNPASPECLAGTAQEAGAVQKADLTLKPGDVLGFRCTSRGGQRNFCLIARSGVLPLFASNERWEAAVEADDAWLKGEGKADVRPQVLRGRVDYNAANAARFEKLARAHSADYSVLWAGSGDTAAFRYRIRPVDLPEKPASR